MSDDEPEGDAQTESTKTRWWATNDVLAAWVLVVTPLILAAGGRGVIDLSAVPKELLAAWIVIALGAGTWAFGIDLLEYAKGGDK